MSGYSSYQAFFYPHGNSYSDDSSNTVFDLVLTGGQFSDVSIGHNFARGAKGASDENFTTGYSIQPEDPTAIGVIGLPTQFSVTLNGVDYTQTFAASNLPPAGSNFSASLTLTPIYGTNVVDTTQPSTASGLFLLTGDVSADIGGTTYTDPLSGYALFSGSYTFEGISGDYMLDESYTFTQALTPEPASPLEMAAGLAALLTIARFRQTLRGLKSKLRR